MDIINRRLSPSEQAHRTDTDLVADLWLQAFELASADFQTLSKDLQAKLSEQEQETGNYYNLMVETEDEASSWRSRAEASESLVVTLQDQIASLKGALHDATSRLGERREIEDLLKSAIALRPVAAIQSSLAVSAGSDSQTQSRNPNLSSVAT
ncbi:hypothetical protein [Paracoccus actinidiae]|uniref:hypothetical protein n=1 Tax=Paracoccus actinidiae TaxID=3064531 RepID=UPI0027D1F65E|nr:hypothetical protein [Paracoccus sp. M09]